MKSSEAPATLSRVSAGPAGVATPEQIREVRRLVDGARRIVVLTGAGISTDSGIPDFRGPQGVWTKDPKAERTSDIAFYVADPEVRALAWQGRLHHPVWEAAPNAGHRALVGLERRGSLHLLVTQNIDGLHQQAGSDPAGVVEVHGTVHRVVCLQCDTRWPMAHALDRAFRAAGEADLLLAVGSTLTVYPIAALPELAAAGGAPVVVVNGSPTQYDDRADAVLRGPLSEILPALVG